MTARDPFDSAQESSGESLNSTKTNQAAANDNGHVETAETTSSLESQRPQLTIQQAAAILGKSVRALERSLIGRWGNKLPEGWNAKKILTINGEEWRISPPIGFKVRSNSANIETESTSEHGLSSGSTDFLSSIAGEFLREAKPQQWLAKRAMYRSNRSENNGIEQATIVIDRSNEVESLLKELLVTQKALSEERRLHMEDMRMVAQLQGHMRLLESSASESTRVKSELEFSQRELNQLKGEYNLLIALPWWKRIFGFGFKRS